jgi:hypothetical protein
VIAAGCWLPAACNLVAPGLLEGGLNSAVLVHQAQTSLKDADRQKPKASSQKR